MAALLLVLRPLHGSRMRSLQLASRSHLASRISHFDAEIAATPQQSKVAWGVSPRPRAASHSPQRLK